ncbi:hypothetical protein [Fulvimarina endophytica]|nr:hypothetical protein [Fulvimarina endophytica]
MVASAKRLLSLITTSIRPAYRPERYYMRGPGPACARRDQGLTAG